MYKLSRRDLVPVDGLRRWYRSREVLLSTTRDGAWIAYQCLATAAIVGLPIRYLALGHL